MAHAATDRRMWAMGHVPGRAALVALLDAVEERLSCAALRIWEACRAQSDAERLQAIARARLALRDANTLLRLNRIAITSGDGVIRPLAPSVREDAQAVATEVEWLREGDHCTPTSR